MFKFCVMLCTTHDCKGLGRNRISISIIAATPFTVTRPIAQSVYPPHWISVFDWREIV